jgi:uncharacterized protein YbjT (DUF2867 family)
LQQERDIQKACKGVQYIISTHGSGGNAQALDYRANIELIDQAKENGVQHFVFISVLGADRGYEDAPVFKAKRAVEKYLEASGLNYTILRPSGFRLKSHPIGRTISANGNLSAQWRPQEPDFDCQYRTIWRSLLSIL